MEGRGLAAPWLTLVAGFAGALVVSCHQPNPAYLATASDARGELSSDRVAETPVEGPAGAMETGAIAPDAGVEPAGVDGATDPPAGTPADAAAPDVALDPPADAPVDLAAADTLVADATAVDASADRADVADPTAPDAPIVMRFTFDNGTDGWADIRYDYYRSPPTPVSSSTVRAIQGRASLELALDTTRTNPEPTFGIKLGAMASRVRAGMRIRYHFWFPAPATALVGVQPFVMYHRAGAVDPVWGGTLQPISMFRPAEWNVFTLVVPSQTTADGVAEVGIEWLTNGPRTLKVYVDDVSIY